MSVTGPSPCGAWSVSRFPRLCPLARAGPSPGGPRSWLCTVGAGLTELSGCLGPRSSRCGCECFAMHAGSARLPPLVPAGPCKMHRELQNQGWSPFFLTSSVRSWCPERLSEPRGGLSPSSSGPSEDRPALSQTGQTSTRETLISLLCTRRTQACLDGHHMDAGQENCEDLYPKIPSVSLF